MEEYVNQYGETYEEYVIDTLSNNEVPWPKAKWISYWKSWEEYEQEQVDRLFMTDAEKYGEDD